MDSEVRDPSPASGRLRRLWDGLGRARGFLIVAIAAGFVLLHFGAAATRSGGPDRLLFGDSRGYFIYLPSLLVDHDLDFRNDWAAVSEFPDEPPAEAPEGRSRHQVDPQRTNWLPVGCAVLWSPFYLVGLLLELAGSTLGGRPWDPRGILPQASAIVAGIVYAAAAALLTARIADRWAPRPAATAAALAVWLATPALYYTAVSPAYSHTTAWFAVSAAVLLWLRVRDRWSGEVGSSPRVGAASKEGRAEPESGGWIDRLGSRGAWACVGLAFGVAASVRPNDGPLILGPVVDVLLNGDGTGRPWRRRIEAVAALAVGSLVGFAPQALASRAMFGSFLGNPLGLSVAVNPSEPGQTGLLRPRLLKPLFDFGHTGLFTWTPITLLAVIGLFWLLRRRPRLGGPLLVTFLVAYYLDAAVFAGIVGTSFGARRFVSLNAVFAVGLVILGTELARRGRPRLPVAIAAVLVAWNLLLFLAYELVVHLEGFHPTLRQLLEWMVPGTG